MNLKLKDCDYYCWFTEEEKSLNDEEALYDSPPLKGDNEEVEEGKGFTFLTPNKLLTRLPILLEQIKTENNLYKFKNKIRQILYL